MEREQDVRREGEDFGELSRGDFGGLSRAAPAEPPSQRKIKVRLASRLATDLGPGDGNPARLTDVGDSTSVRRVSAEVASEVDGKSTGQKQA